MRKFLLRFQAALLIICLSLGANVLNVSAEDDTSIQIALGETNKGSRVPYYYYEPTSQFYVELYTTFISLPPYVHALFSAKNAKLNVLDSPLDIETLYNMGTEKNNVDGIFDPGILNIFVESSMDAATLNYYLTTNTYALYGKGRNITEIQKARSKYVMCHEIGHFIDFCLTRQIYKPELIQILNSEQAGFRNTSLFKFELFCSQHHFQNPSEYLADVYACYFIYPDELAKYCPQTYSYMQAVEAHFNALLLQN